MDDESTKIFVFRCHCIPYQGKLHSAPEKLPCLPDEASSAVCRCQDPHLEYSSRKCRSGTPYAPTGPTCEGPAAIRGCTRAAATARGSSRIRGQVLILKKNTWKNEIKRRLRAYVAVIGPSEPAPTRRRTLAMQVTSSDGGWSRSGFNRVTRCNVSGPR